MIIGNSSTFPRSERHVPDAAVRQRAVRLLAGHAGPEARHAAGERAAPGRVVPAVLGRVRGRAVRRVAHHGLRARVPGGADAGVRRRDQRAAPAWRAGHRVQLEHRDRPPAGVRARLDAAVVEASDAGQLCRARRRRARLVTGIFPTRTACRLFDNIA